MTKAIVIPYDDSQPVYSTEISEPGFAELDDMHRLIFPDGEGERRGFISVSAFRQHGAQFIYDDMGLLSQPQNVNSRAMKLWAHLAGRPVEHMIQNLWGVYVVLGCNPDTGETEDAPQVVIDFFAEEGAL